MADGGKVIIKVDGDTKPFKNSMETAKDGLSSLNKSFTAIGAVGVAGFAAATKAGMSFESQMSSVQAISGATASDMELLTAKAKEMGIESAFSATESGKALEYMAMAGWKTEDMLGGIEGVMNLAAASGEDLGMVSDIVTDSMTAFGLSADQSGRFADVLAAASSNANTNVAMLGETFKYVAPVAGSLGFNVEDTAVAIGLMANAGIKGSQAGTALRTTLTRLAKPTKESQQAMDDLGISLTDSSGQIKPFNVLLQNLRESFSTLDDAEKAQYAAMISGQEGMSGMLAIVNASEGDFNKLTEAINNSAGSAEQMANVKLDDLQGHVTLLGSSFEGLGIAIYEKFGDNFQGIVEGMIKKINDFIEKLSNGELDGLLSGIAAGITAIGTALLLLNVAYMIQDVINVFNGLAASTKLVSVAQAALNLVMNMNPFVLIATLVASLVAALIVLWNTNEDFRNAIIGIWDAIKNAFKMAIEKIKGFFSGLIKWFKEFPSKMRDIGKNLVDGLWSGIKNSKDWLLGKVKDWCGSLLDGIKAFFGIHSPSTVMRDEVGKMITEGIAVGIEKATPTLEEAIKNQKQTIVDHYKGIAQTAIDSIDEISKSEDKLASKLKDFGSLYTTNKVVFGDIETEFFGLADIGAQTADLEKYAQLLLDVQARGNVPKEFFAQLRDMSVEEGTKFAKALLSANDDTFNQYMRDWEEKQNISDEISKMLYADETETAKTEIQASFEEFDTDLAEQGKENAEAWGQGFIEQIKEIMPNVKATINSAFAGIVTDRQLAYAGAGTSNTYSSTYYVQAADGESTQKQIWALKNAEFIKEQRGF